MTASAHDSRQLAEIYDRVSDFQFEAGKASSSGRLLAMVPEGLRASLRADLVAAFESQRGPEGLVVRGWGSLLVAKRT
jgi:hypothetical protein